MPNDPLQVLITDAFEDPELLPDAVTMVTLIEKAKLRQAFDDVEYQWLTILLEQLWYSQEFRMRMRLYYLESALKSASEKLKSKQT